MLMFEKYPDRVAAVKWAWSVGGGKRLVGGDWIFTDEQLDRLRFDYDALAARLAEAEAAAKTWENEAERRSRRYEKAAVRLAEAERLLRGWDNADAITIDRDFPKADVDAAEKLWDEMHAFFGFGATVSADEVPHE